MKIQRVICIHFHKHCHSCFCLHIIFYLVSWEHRTLYTQTWRPLDVVLSNCSPTLDQGRLSHSNSSSLILLAWLPPGPPISLLNAGITSPHQAIFTWMGAGVENLGPHFFAANTLHTQLLLLKKEEKKRKQCLIIKLAEWICCVHQVGL